MHTFELFSLSDGIKEEERTGKKGKGKGKVEKGKGK
jgi:hypothetical protein